MIDQEPRIFRDPETVRSFHGRFLTPFSNLVCMPKWQHVLNRQQIIGVLSSPRVLQRPVIPTAHPRK
jgi:hypothetical protein